jgi:hypothetical protein
MPIPGPIFNLSWTQVYFLLRIEDTVWYLTLIGKHGLLVPSRLHYCDNACFTCFLSADFTQCPCGAFIAEIMLQGNNLYLLTMVTMIPVA